MRKDTMLSIRDEQTLRKEMELRSSASQTIDGEEHKFLSISKDH